MDKRKLCGKVKDIRERRGKKGMLHQGRNEGKKWGEEMEKWSPVAYEKK